MSNVRQIMTHLLKDKLKTPLKLAIKTGQSHLKLVNLDFAHAEFMHINCMNLMWKRNISFFKTKNLGGFCFLQLTPDRLNGSLDTESLLRTELCKIQQGI